MGLKPIRMVSDGAPEGGGSDFHGECGSSGGGGGGSTTRSKGITLNLAVSPVVANKSPSERTGSFLLATEAPEDNLSGEFVAGLDQEMPQHRVCRGHDGSIPPVAQLETWDIDAQLRLLALKEMAVVEIKDSIAKMQRHLQKNEADLHQLREIIQKSLYKELTVSSAPQRERKNSNPRQEAIANTKSRRSFSISNSQPPRKPQDPIKTDSDDDKSNSKIWNGLSKPLNLLLQLDTMLQNEFEKSLIPNQVPSNGHGIAPVAGHVRGRKSEDSVSSVSTASPLKHKSGVRPTQTDYDRLVDDKSDDIFQSVSTSLWSFVNDVKTNVLSSLSEEQEGEIYSLENGSSISLDKMTEFPKITESVPVENVNNSDYEDDGQSDGNDEKLDLSMYANLRKKSR